MNGLPFVGRQSELKSLNDLTKKKTSSLVVMQGRRRIGKSRLAAEFAKTYKFFRFSGLPPLKETSAQSERDAFSSQLAAHDLPVLKADDWSDLFRYLAKETQKGRVVILFDEISWMGSKDPQFLGKLKNAWDLEFKNNPQLMLILCGSVSAWIEENILKSTGFMGRLSLTIQLDELTLPECNQLLKAIGFHGNQYEIFKILSVTGGVPRYLEEIKPDRLVEENIKDLCFKKGSVLSNEFENIFSDIFSRRNEVYKKIVESLVGGVKELSEIAQCIGMEIGGNVTQYLFDLVVSGFIKRDFTWDIKGEKLSKLSHYRLSDNYLRFYLKYIAKNKQKIERGLFDEKSLTTIPGFDSIMGLQFENVVLNNRKSIWEKLNLHADNIITDNPYFQRQQIRKKGCQIDYLIQLKIRMLYACEIKFSRQEIKTSIINEMKEKLSRLHLPRGFAVAPVLIHVNGVSEAVVEQGYFSHIINFSDFLI